MIITRPSWKYKEKGFIRVYKSEKSFLKTIFSLLLLATTTTKNTKKPPNPKSIPCVSPSDVSFRHGGAQMAHSVKRYYPEVHNPSTWHREDGWQILFKDMLVYTSALRTVFQINPFKIKKEV